ncbi:hypothetical protein ACLOJK_037579 [Asimina triloba]
MDCEAKQIMLKSQHEINFAFNAMPKGDMPRLISPLKVVRLVRQGCVAFLASIVDSCPESRPFVAPRRRDGGRRGHGVAGRRHWNGTCPAMGPIRPTGHFLPHKILPKIR